MPRALRRIAIKTFPENISREMFGAYISGFVDGEGCFSLTIGHHVHNKTPLCRFAIQVRQDDIEILRLIQSFFGCGIVSSKKSVGINQSPAAYFVAVRIGDLKEVIVQHFELFPLFAKKRRDFVIWKDAVDLAFRVHIRKRTRMCKGSRAVTKWTGQERSQFQSLMAELKDIRKFATSEPEPRGRIPNDFPLFPS